MTPDVQKVLDTARSDLFVRESGGDNRGYEVEAMLASVGCVPGDPWCAAAVYWIGTHALGPRWPLPKTGSCYVLGEHARKRGNLVTQPGPGDVFLLWSETKQRFHHTGFVEQALSADRYATLEGNTDPAGSANGYGFFAKERVRGDKDRFIRWTAELTEVRPLSLRKP